MTPGKFLRLIWPDQGPYCIAHPFKPENSTVTVYAHRVFPTISEAVTHVHQQANLQDVYFAILSLKADRVWDPDKTDYKTQQKGAWAVRKQENMHLAKCLFNDLDVGPEATKYPTQQDALLALADFLTKTKLPTPTLISSGGGVHTYWHFDRALGVEEWRVLAWHLRQLEEGLGLKVDPTRTIDTTSVLRVPDTFNWKDKSNPRKVQVLQEGAVTPVEQLRQIIADAMVANGIVPTDAPPPRTVAAIAHELGPQGFNDFGPPPTLEELGDACGQVRRILKSQVDPTAYEPLDNTAWYRGMLATIKHVKDGDDWCRKLTALHPRDNADLETKLLQLAPFAPAKCTTLQQYMPWKDDPCQGCKFRDKVPNPLAAARKNTPALPPSALPTGVVPPVPVPPTPASPSPAHGSASGGVQQLMAPSALMGTIAIPNPPKPYERLKAGGISVTRKDKDGNETSSTIFPHDLYPLKRLVNIGEQREQQTWRVTLPRSGARDFTIDADVLYDSRKFCVAIANNGIYPNKADIPALQDYMVAYISQLQKTIDADSQSNHLGWAKDYSEFVLPDKTLKSDGTVLASTLSIGAERAAQFIRKVGDPNAQRTLLEFYNKPEYVANQFAILCSLASVIFDMTGHHGIVVNCSGDAGASKSTTLYTAAGLWGDPVMWPINGTNRGATANARMQRIATNANLPTCVDEITHMPPREAIDLVMGITQPGHRLRLTTDGVERKMDDGYKSAIMLSTANSSLHSLISQDSAAGTAGSMRVFEIRFAAQTVHAKAEADEYLRQIKQHYGHIGELFAHFVIKNREMVMKRVHQVMREIDTEGKIVSSERFWSAVIAVVYVTAEISQAIKLLPYDAEAIRHWALHDQIPHMRGVVKVEYRDPLAILTDYIAEKHGNIVVIDKATSIGANTSGQAVAGDTAFAVNQPHGALVGHYDLKAGVLLLLKQAFKEYCSRIGASMPNILNDLSQGPKRVVVDKHCRRTLGAGTNLAKGQVWCLAIDMTNPEIAGTVPVLAVSNPPPPPANDASAVV
jgi:hypothetical protein